METFKFHFAILLTFVIAIVGMAISDDIASEGILPLALILAVALAVAYSFGYDKGAGDVKEVH